MLASHSHGICHEMTSLTAMIKTTNLTRTLLNHHGQSHSLPICAPPAHASSGSESETTTSVSPATSRQTTRNTLDDSINALDQASSVVQDESNAGLLNLVDKLKRELGALKQAKTQLETLYKVSSAAS